MGTRPDRGLLGQFCPLPQVSNVLTNTLDTNILNPIAKIFTSIDLSLCPYLAPIPIVFTSNLDFEEATITF